jgi:hypothetical protein
VVAKWFINILEYDVRPVDGLKLVDIKYTVEVEDKISVAYDRFGSIEKVSLDVLI